jgi:hypothetical protein
VRKATFLVAAVLAVGACARSPGDAGTLRVVPLDGQVRLLGDGDPVLLEEETEVDLGDMVATGPQGRALLQLGAAGTLELGSQARVRVDPRPEVVRGSVLARAAEPGLGVRAGDTEIRAEGSVFRVDRGFSVIVAVYQGAAEILGSGIPLVPAFRQATVLTGGAVPRGPQPLSVRPDHPWDIRLLGAAIDLGLDLVELQRGLTRQLPQREADAAVLRALDGAFPVRKVEEVLRRVDAAAETLLAAEVSRSAAEASEAPPLQVLDEVVDFRLEGAHWIVVVARWGLGGTGLLQGLEHLVGIIERLIAPPSPVTTEGPGSPTPGPGGVSGGGSADVGSLTSGGSDGAADEASEGTDGTTDAGGTGDSGGTGGTGGSGGTGPGGGGSGPGPLPPPEEGCGPVECLVTDLVDQLDDPGPGGGGLGGGDGLGDGEGGGRGGGLGGGGGLGEILP